jgi:hypothetical protein
MMNDSPNLGTTGRSLLGPSTKTIRAGATVAMDMAAMAMEAMDETAKAMVEAGITMEATVAKTTIINGVSMRP